uniref:Endoribonuclease n=1 Tax=Plectus sambesii TaxID=2011161 RepID=A0A914WX70_9BILA
MANSFLRVLFIGVQLITIALADLSDSNIISVVNQMRQQDVNAAKAGDIVVNYQNQASHSNFDHDNAPQPFFTHVNENLFNGPTYQAYLKLVALFVTPDVFVPEPVTTAQTAAGYAFIDSISTTGPFQTMWSFLSSNGRFTDGDL